MRFTGKSERGLSLSKDGLKVLLKTEEIKKSIPRARATLKKFRKYTYIERRESREMSSDRKKEVTRKEEVRLSIEEA